MQSGLTRLGLVPTLTLLALPLLLAGATVLGTRHYCTRADRDTRARTTAMAHARELYTALQGARTTLRDLPIPAESTAGDSEDFGRWLHDAANQHYIQLQQLAIRHERPADPVHPVIRATFRMEAPISQLILLLYNLQRFPRLICYDAIHLHHGSPNGTGPTYVAEITLLQYALPALPAPPLASALPATPLAAEQILIDRQTMARLRKKAGHLQRQLLAATSALNLADTITITPPPTAPPPPTNQVEVAVAPLPPPPPPPPAEPVFDLRGISFSGNRPLTLLNNRWRQTGDLVSSNGGWHIGAIEPARVILVNTQGIPRILPFFPTPPPPPQTAQLRTP
jgi:hypothetical protein